MIMESKRLFVGNLPPGVTDTDLKNEFSAYGNVQKVELKFKENLVDPTNPSFFAFIVIESNERQIKQCIDEFSREQYSGRYLTVSVARESFLERLKREREEAGLTNIIKEENLQLKKTDDIKIVKKLPTLKPVTKKTESSSSESESESSSSSESESTQTNKHQNAKKIEEPEEFIAKKRASNSIQNGKIKIQTNLSSHPIHIINKKEKNIQNNLDDKGKIADKKRKESMHKMKDQYTKQKLAIQQSLAAVDSNKSRKICFDDGDNEINITKNDGKSETSSKKIDLFNDDDEEENNFQNDFAVKEQFQGEKGQKLMKLQSKFQLDPRFKMNKAFMEVDDNDETNNHISKSTKNDIHMSTNEDNDDERKWQLGIIEQVVGHKFDSLSEVNRKKIRKTMLRYDPTKQEHEKFLKNIEKVTKNITTIKSSAINIESNEVIDTNEVSKEQFFRINDDLTNSLRRRGDGFSLLSMFGRPEEINDNNQTNVNDEKVLISSKPNNQNNPFKFDSSDSEDDETDITKINSNKSLMETNDNQISNGGKTTKTGIWTENLFISSDDPRLIDGAEFFKAIKRNNDENKEDYDQVKNKLKNIINKKISKTKKNLKINNKGIKKRNFKNRK